MSMQVDRAPGPDQGFDFPFSAVVGQEQFKLALILVAINPGIGGVVVSGPRGSAKSTLARGLADLIAPVDGSGREPGHHSPFVTLPLGASEEMLLGTLDLQQVLDDKQVQFSPGLLSKAHGGVLYVDEVNLLPDNLVDLLLDVAASGVNWVERDGISHSHAARFLLLGTMNPDEGDLRPQLHDRFGLSVELTSHHSAAERVAIVKAREAFDRQSAEFCQDYAQQQGQLIAGIAAAQACLAGITCSDALRLEIAKRCEQAKVDGLRADIVWYRAALAHAAWRQASELSVADLDAVEELVLAHRRRSHDSDNGDSANNDEKNNDAAPPKPKTGSSNAASPENKSPFKRPPDSHRPPNDGPADNSSENNGSSGNEPADGASSGKWGSMPPQTRQQLQPVKFNLDPRRTNTSWSRSQLAHHTAARHGSGAAGLERGWREGRHPDWFRTIISNIATWPPRRLRFKPARQGSRTLNLLVIDTSASMLAAGVFELAKGAALHISQTAYLKREQLVVIGFGNGEVKELMPQKRAPKALERWLHSLQAGGGTPVVEAISAARRYALAQLAKSPNLALRTFVISDGCTRAQLANQAFPGDLVWLDSETSTVPRGRGQQLAAQLGGAYLSLTQLAYT